MPAFAGACAGEVTQPSLSGIVSVDGAPGDAPERRRPPASPNLEPRHAETAPEIDIFAKIERLAELQQKGILSP
jgi:hypothetical protein